MTDVEDNNLLVFTELPKYFPQNSLSTSLIAYPYNAIHEKIWNVKSISSVLLIRVLYREIFY